MIRPEIQKIIDDLKEKPGDWRVDYSSLSAVSLSKNNISLYKDLISFDLEINSKKVNLKNKENEELRKQVLKTYRIIRNNEDKELFKEMEL